MLTEIELENFKAFGPRVSLPLAPLTLLLGGNCAGNLSVFHAPHLAWEVLTRSNLDPDRAEMGGGSLGRTEVLAFEDEAQFALTHPEATEEADESAVPFHREGDDATRVVFEIRRSRVAGGLYGTGRTGLGSGGRFTIGAQPGARWTRSGGR